MYLEWTIVDYLLGLVVYLLLGFEVALSAVPFEARSCVLTTPRRLAGSQCTCVLGWISSNDTSKDSNEQILRIHALSVYEVNLTARGAVQTHASTLSLLLHIQFETALSSFSVVFDKCMFSPVTTITSYLTYHMAL